MLVRGLAIESALEPRQDVGRVPSMSARLAGDVGIPQPVLLRVALVRIDMEQAWSLATWYEDPVTVQESTHR